MRVLIGCEESQTVCKAFRALGHYAISCDILPCSGGHPEWHYQGDIFDIIEDQWDMGIFFPPCTHLCVSGAKHFAAKRADGRQQQGIDFFMRLANCAIPRTSIENPIGIMSTIYRKPDQIIQPWQFGHGETKATCLWLKGLPKLTPTNIVDGRTARVHRMPPSPERARMRSVTFEGIAQAMSEQWGCL